MIRFRFLASCLALLFLAAACNGNDVVEDAQEAPPGELERPQIDAPDGEPPDELVVEDLWVGTGAEAGPGTVVQVHYVGVAWSSGEEFDASWERGQAFAFELGAGMVIPGWDEGVEGMREGGRRQLIIPPDLAYGERSPGPGIGPNETLVFVVDLLEVD